MAGEPNIPTHKKVGEKKGWLESRKDFNKMAGEPEKTDKERWLESQKLRYKLQKRWLESHSMAIHSQRDGLVANKKAVHTFQGKVAGEPLKGNMFSKKQKEKNTAHDIT